MKWNQRYLLGSYLRSSLWLVPFFSIPLSLIAVRALHWLDVWLGWRLLGFQAADAKTLLEAFVSATLAFVVFTFGSLLVAIQIASAQMTPRIIATTLLRNDLVKYTVGLLIFTLMFALGAQNRLDEQAYQLMALVAILLGMISFAAFFYLIDYASRLLRPISILTRVGDSGIAVAESVYPEPSSGSTGEREPRMPSAPEAIIRHRRNSGIVLAVNIGSWSRRPRFRAALSNSCPRSATLLRPTIHSSDFMPVRVRSMRTPYVPWSRSGRNAPWTRIPPLRSALSWISLSRRSLRPSTIRPRRSLRSTSFTACCGSSI